MTGRRDYYQVLGVPRDADDKTIKNAFRRYRRAPSPVGCCGSRAGACLAISGAAGAARTSP